MGPSPARGTAALQAALTAEQAAIYGYGVVGAHLSGTGLAAATADWTAHQVAANRLAALLQAAGVTPDSSSVAYKLPHPVATPAQAVALAAALEDQVASAYVALVADTRPAVRTLAARELRDAALRGATWRGRTAAFPGLSAADLARASRPS